MLNALELKEYRLLSGLSQRDVAMSCDVSHRLIREVENRERNLTEYNYQEIIKGINRARQAKANGTFEADKKKFSEKENEYEKNRQAEKRAEAKATQTTKKSTKSTASKVTKNKE